MKRWVCFLTLILGITSLTALGQETRESRQRELATGRAAPTTAPTGEKIDETPVVTRHEIQVGGKTLKYTTTVAQMPIKTAGDEAEAHIFYMAYTLDGVS